MSGFLPLCKVVSGGQTGVDRAALRAARAAGLAVGGWCPPGRVSEAGAIPEELPLTETPRDRSELAPDTPRSQRTEWNVRDADATLILGPAESETSDPGTEFTARCAARLGRPVLTCDATDPEAAERIVAWIRTRGVGTLNVAGPSEASAPGIGAASFELLRAVFGAGPGC